MDACPSDDDIAAFSLGLLDADAALVIELHLDSCARCSEVVTSLGLAYGQSSVPSSRRKSNAESLPSAHSLPTFQPQTQVKATFQAQPFSPAGLSSRSRLTSELRSASPSSEPEFELFPRPSRRIMQVNAWVMLGQALIFATAALLIWGWSPLSMALGEHSSFVLGGAIVGCAWSLLNCHGLLRASGWAVPSSRMLSMLAVCTGVLTLHGGFVLYSLRARR